MNVTEVQKYIVTTVASFALLAISIAAYVTPPILAIGDPLRVILLVAALGGLGLQVQQGYTATRAVSALRGRNWR
jgi:hypothetical protein